MSEDRMYTINDYLNDKNDMEMEIEELRKKRENLDNEIKEKEEKYHEFVTDYLKRNSLYIKTFDEEVD